MLAERNSNPASLPDAVPAFSNVRFSHELVPIHHLHGCVSSRLSYSSEARTFRFLELFQLQVLRHLTDSSWLASSHKLTQAHRIR